MTSPVTVARVRVNRIAFHPLNIRRDLGDLRDLTASIKRFGVMQPIVVEQYGSQLRLRAGHRRTAAAGLAGVDTIPAVIHAEVLDDDEFVMQALHENVMRRGLDERERRDVIRKLFELGCTAEGIARDLSVTRQTVSRWAMDPETRYQKSDRRRVPATAVRKVVTDWRERAARGLSPQEALQLIDQLEVLAAPSLTAPQEDAA